MTRYRLSWLLFTLASGAVLAVSCGGDDDTTGSGGSGGKGGSAGSTATGGTGGTGGSSGTGGTAGSAGKDGGSKDTGSTRIPCGETTCAATQYCDPAGPTGPRCVACMNDMHCANNMQNPPRTRCDAPAGVCKSCLTDAHCTPPQRCIMGMMPTSNNTCQTRCTSDADCASQTTNRACNVTTMMCVECQNNTHCAATPNTPACVGDSCEQCATDADCASRPGMPFCNATTNVCEACLTNANCAEPTPVCITQGTNRCAECGVNTDCTGRPGGGACVTNVCRQCNAQVPCPAGNTCTMNTCVPVPEAGPPEAGREGGSDVGSDGGPETGADAPQDATADATSG